MATSISLRYANERKNFLVYTGMPVEELKSIIRGAFNIEFQVVGVCDATEDVHYPIAIVSRAPSYFTSKPFEVSVLWSEYCDDDDEEEDDDVDGDKVADNMVLTDDVFHLTEEQTRELLRSFQLAARYGDVDRATFETIFENVLGRHHSSVSIGSTLSKLFDLFDRDGNGLVDAREFQTGLSVIGTSDARNTAVRKAFEAYDLDGTGYISLQEMTTYLISVFSVIASSSPEVFENNQVTPTDLANATAMKCFEDLGVPSNGRLDFDQFQTWYTSPDSQNLITMEHNANDQVVPATGLPPLNTIRAITGLGGLDPSQVFKLFADKAPSGALSRRDFIHAFELIKPVASFDSHSEYAGYTNIVDKLFDLFDADGDGVVDYTELASGLSVLCGGSRDDKVMAAFVLFDTNGDGFITKEEMVTYLTSVFKVMYQASPSADYEVSPDVLAQATADQCFIDADANGDGRLSFEEFKNWYSESGAMGPSTESASIVKKLEDINVMEEIKFLTNIESYDISSLINFFSTKSTPDGFLTKDSFYHCFKDLIDRNSSIYSPAFAQYSVAQFDEHVLGLLDEVFRIFDTDMNGVVDLSEVGAGLSILCGGARDDKVLAAFALFDEDGDGCLTMQELVNYLAAVYRVLFASSPETREAAGMSPEELAFSTASKYFEDAGTLVVSFDEFQNWYNQPHGVDEDDEEFFSFAEMSTLTNLATTHVDTVFQMLAHCSDEDGVLSQMSFNGCFRALVGQDHSREELERINQLLHYLFHIFDFSNSGLVSFDHLASGISVLCGGNHSEKISAAFALYDIGDTGFITQDEMASYLGAVYTVLLKSSPETQQRLGLSAADLAEITAEDAFSNLNGQMSFDHFSRWCSENIAPPASQEEEADMQVTRSLEDIRRLSRLETADIVDVFEAFAECADDRGLISRDDFTACMAFIISDQIGPAGKDRLADEIFDIFDADGNGVVDFTELASGLSLLCGGSREDKVMAAFRLFDINGDGFITKEEMETYLTSVFRVIYATRPELATSLGVGPEILSQVTTAEAFENADLNQDGRISFPEFQQWYSQDMADMLSPPADVPQEQEEPEVSLDYVRSASGLRNCDVHTMFAIFADAASNDGMLSVGGYFDSFGAIMERSATSAPDFDKLNLMLMRIFQVYDTNSTDSVELIELLCGMTVLCGGDREEKVKAAFGLIDSDDDGYISQEELYAYLKSIFKMLHDTKRASEANVDASTLAEATTTAAFTQARTSYADKISLSEFTNWYSNAESFEVGGSVPSESDTNTLSNFERARWLLNLDRHSLTDLLDTLVEAGPDGTLNRQQFLTSMLMLVRLGGNLDPQTSEFEEAATLMELIFAEFDLGNVGRVDLSQLAAGLSILCAVPMGDKIDFAFALFDFDNDGQVSFSGLTEYMASVFKVLFVTSPELKKLVDGNLDTETLAEVTTTQAFKEAGLSKRSKLEKQVFQNFVRIGLGSI
jgi:Ca2+-binding EF-hand superfamily protein